MRRAALYSLLSGLMLVLCVLGLFALYFSATDFPTNDPIIDVDEALVEKLRANPGLHLALSPDYKLKLALELEDDALNRQVYGTHVDSREKRAKYSIHIQAKGPRFAIHADRHNPRFSLWMAILHGTVDVPMVPLILGALLSFVALLMNWRGREADQEVP